MPKVGDGIYGIECGSRIGFGPGDATVANVTIQSAEGVFPAGAVAISEVSQTVK